MIKPLILLVAWVSLLSSCRPEEVPNHAYNAFAEKTLEEKIDYLLSEERDKWQKPAELIDKLALNPDEMVAEIGPGAGYFTFRMAEKCHHLTAIDIDSSLLIHLRKKTPKELLDKISLRISTEEKPNLEELTYDKIVLINVCHQLYKKAKYLNELRKKLRFGGSLYIIDFKSENDRIGPPIEHRIALRDVKRELGLAGYNKVEEMEDFLPYQYMIKAN